MKGKKILITAGPTYEKIDPVRFIGNYSSGKMGFALAEECAKRGAEVTLIAGPVALSCSSGIHRVNVESCQEMYNASIEAFPWQDAAILCAAVADFKPATTADRKIKGGRWAAAATGTHTRHCRLAREDEAGGATIGGIRAGDRP